VLLAQVDRLLQGGSSRAEPEGHTSVAPVELVLYVTAGATASARARRNVESVLARFDPATYLFSVCDLAEDPLRGERDRVVFSPTLVKHRPEPRTWLLGDLANADALQDLLLLCGAVLAPASPR
jgi:circadian clock protein KaiB